MNLHEAETLAKTAMRAHGLYDWTFRFDRAKRRSGQTNYSTRTITLSAPLTQVRKVEEVRQTIGHEIAHALVGPGAGHGPVWKAKMRELGLKVERCSVDSDETVEARQALRNYELTCSITGKSLGHLDRIVKQRKIKRGSITYIRTYGARVCQCHFKPVLYNGREWDAI